MQSLGDAAYTKLHKIAAERDITVQELIRAIVIPDWLKMDEKRSGGEGLSERHRKRMSRSRARTQTPTIAPMPRQKTKQ